VTLQPTIVELWIGLPNLVPIPSNGDALVTKADQTNSLPLYVITIILRELLPAIVLPLMLWDLHASFHSPLLVPLP
jgi:hypothetical protein